MYESNSSANLSYEEIIGQTVPLNIYIVIEIV